MYKQEEGERDQLLIYSLHHPAHSAGLRDLWSNDCMGNSTCVSENTVQPNDSNCVVPFCIRQSTALTCFSWQEGRVGKRNKIGRSFHCTFSSFDIYWSCSSHKSAACIHVCAPIPSVVNSCIHHQVWLESSWVDLH